MELVIRLAGWPVVLRRAALMPRADGTRAQAQSVFDEKDVARYQRRALRDAVDLLVGGGALVIFPEGFPNIDPNFTPKTQPAEFLPFSAGFAVIAAAAEKRLQAPIPIVPVGFRYVCGTPWRVRICFGDPLYAGGFASRRELVRAVEQAVTRLSVGEGCDSLVESGRL
jgi:1-acyl-sn-glycerol-3-phosphate acyltransferase